MIKKKILGLQKSNIICIKQQARRKEFCKGIISERSAKPRVALTNRIFYKNCAHGIRSVYHHVQPFAYEGLW